MEVFNGGKGSEKFAMIRTSIPSAIAFQKRIPMGLNFHPSGVYDVARGTRSKGEEASQGEKNRSCCVNDAILAAVKDVDAGCRPCSSRAGLSAN